MGKQQQQQSRKGDKLGKGKVTPVQVAFIVDRYLSDHNFLRTRSAFRDEASHLLSKSPVSEAPKSLLSLGDMLDEYISLKEHKVLLTQDRHRLDHEKLRVHTLLRGMQDVMNAYATPPPPLPLLSPPVNNTTPLMMSTAANTVSSDPPNFSTPSTSQPNSKRRKNPKHVTAASKRTRTQPSTLNSSASSVKPPSNHSHQITPIPPPTTVSPVQGSSVAKCLFNQPAPQTPSPSPPPADNQTPPSTNNNTTHFTSTNRTVITSETIRVSPMKQVSVYSIERRNHCITSPMKTGSKRFSTTRDHVKGRLDFDGSEMLTHTLTSSDENTDSPSQPPDAFDFELPNLDCLGADFNLTDLLGDFDLDFAHPDDNGSSPECLSGSPGTMVDDGTADHELVSGMSSTVTEIRSEQDMNMPGSNGNSVTSVKSITKCIKVFSPVKSRNP